MQTFKAFCGAEKPLVARGKNQSRLLRFAAEYPGWHSHANDRATIRAVEGLHKSGAIVLNQHGQFAIAYGQFMKDAV